MLFGGKKQNSYSLENKPLVIEASYLGLDERLEFKYDKNHNLIAIQKIKLSLFEGRQEGKAKTQIHPGKLGRVDYGGSSWKAYCDGDSIIEVDEEVLIMGHIDAVTLIVVGLA